MRRRSAKKSRYGCKECKRRHVKCDETKPSCANCVIRQLQCSFVSGLPTPQSITSTPTATTTDSCGLISPLSQDKTILTVSSPVNYVLPEPTFQLHHLELFHHFEHDMWRFVSLDDMMGKNFIAMVARHAITIPYLMDQLLAFSAAHMSTHRPYQACFYREEATHLQTRALGLFNAAKATGEAFPAFLFSILLSHQILFDTFSTRADFPTFLDKLVTSLHLCAGVRAIAGESWNSISMQYYEQTGMELPYKWILDTDSETIFTKKLTLAVPTDFVKLVEQRRPEALIITAYYGVLIHNARDFWVFGDAGAFIIRSITRYLGSCWDEWLAWPNEVLRVTG
ncbi:hypothetical protein F4860DRAFT_501783 [Xylaria cubensis]|nr:hypothetical protein F4860DRAFT_501783 [Xylaria cubensis]